jgi:hypothetical protein
MEHTKVKIEGLTAIHSEQLWSRRIASSQTFATTACNPRARFALDIASKMALVAAVPDGEDVTGRQRMRMMSAKEITDRSIEIADRMFNAFSQYHWELELPDPELIPARESDTD